jgi:hypothetical protein
MHLLLKVFGKLKVLGRFCGGFTTLKETQKVPVLPETPITYF